MNTQNRQTKQILNSCLFTHVNTSCLWHKNMTLITYTMKYFRLNYTLKDKNDLTIEINFKYILDEIFDGFVVDKLNKTAAKN